MTQPENPAPDLRPLPRSARVGRFLLVARMVVTIYAGYKARQLLGYLTGGSADRHYYDNQHRRAAHIVRHTAVRLEGLLVKACQFAGSRADVLPRIVVEILSELQDRVPPKPFGEIRQAIESGLGRPIEECYAEIDETPVAAASLAQVHRARTHDGRDVAVKVQYPGIDRIVASDLRNIAFFINLLARIETTFDFRLVIHEMKTLVPLELDFVNEAANAVRFARNFENDPEVMFPEPLPELTSRTVLTMGFIDGVKITDIDALERAGIDKHAVAELLVRAYLAQVFTHGFFHGDPHPGNLLVLPGPVLVILDLGLAKEFTPKLRIGVILLATAIVARDPKTIAQAFRNLGFETRSGDDDTLVSVGELLLGEALHAGKAYADMALVERVQEELLAALRENPLVRASSDLLLLLRVVGLMSGVGKQLDSRVDPLHAMLPYLQGKAGRGSS